MGPSLGRGGPVENRRSAGAAAGEAADTIFALSSGAPPAGVAVIRISGAGAGAAVADLAGAVPEPRRAALRTLRGGDGEILDRGLVLFLPGPGSFTGEDVAELQVHGGRAVVAAVLTALAARPGFRPAEAGEFTRRAFLNGRLDLTETEGLADLVFAETEAQRRQALRQAEGGLRAVYDRWRERLVRVRALVEAELDFPDEEDVPGAAGEAAWDEAAAVRAEILAHLADGRRGERLRHGAEIVVVGPPNAGKSSLVNALARRDAAIVSSEPGTTRDLIEVRLDLDGYPATLVDTAGLRDAAGAVEQEGVRRAEARAAAADLVLWLEPVVAEAEAVRGGVATPAGAPVLRIGTKLDLVDGATARRRAESRFDLAISVRSGAGMEALLDRLAAFVAEELAPGEHPLITRERYRTALAACAEAIGAAVAGGAAGLELRAEELRRASDALGRLTGRVDVEDLLDVIFRDFCIGK